MILALGAVGNIDSLTDGKRGRMFAAVGCVIGFLGLVGQFVVA